MPNVSGLMNDCERAICARLKEFRETERYPRNVFAERLGITDVRLVSIEHGWTPLRYELARRCAELFDLNLRWLALGAPPKKPRVPIPADVATKANERGLFSKVYADALAEHFEGSSLFVKTVDELRRELDALTGGTDVPASLSFVVPRPAAVPALKRRLELLRRYSARLEQKIEIDAQAIKASRDHYGPPPGEAATESYSANSGVDILSESLISGSVNDTLETLLASVRSATRARGAKTALAQDLHIAPQQLNDWLTGRSKPSAEHVLELLRWGFGKDGTMKQYPTAARTAAGRKAPTKGHNESPTTGPCKGSQKKR